MHKNIATEMPTDCARKISCNANNLALATEFINLAIFVIFNINFSHHTSTSVDGDPVALINEKRKEKNAIKLPKITLASSISLLSKRIFVALRPFSALSGDCALHSTPRAIYGCVGRTTVECLGSMNAKAKCFSTVANRYIMRHLW